MTLPFNNKRERKWVCFVCGQSFTEYKVFSEHVIAEHQEGREYVKCPKCQAPVRDVRLHFTAKHPNEKLMKEGQMRATVWFDFSGKDGKRKRSHKKPNFQEGYMVSAKNRGTCMHYRSGYELEVYSSLEEINEVVAYQVEPEDCITSYYFQNKWHKYHPDLKVVFDDGHVEIWEIKPSNQTDLPVNKEKFESCAEFCEQRGYKFVVKTEQGIKKLQKKVLDQNKKK